MDRPAALAQARASERRALAEEGLGVLGEAPDHASVLSFGRDHG